MAFLLPEIILAVNLCPTKVKMRLLLTSLAQNVGFFQIQCFRSKPVEKVLIISYIITILKNGSANLRENNVPKQKPQNTFISEIVSE
jgi:hypothetical protein